MKVKVVGIKFIDGSRIYYFSPNNLDLKINDYVIVETERGMQFAQAVTNIIEEEENKLYLPLKNVVKLATKKDIIQNDKNITDGKKALEYAKKIVLEDELDMKLLDATYTFDKKKLIFKFIADERVDFRELAKNLASKYKTRIELRQIGVRDKAKEIGGLGPCGRPLCCSEFLSNFDSVSINMAKNQGLALNPSKINGSCGRLLCCLAYEDEVYSIYKKGMPKLNQKIKIKDIEGKVCELNILKRTYKIKTEDNMIIEMDCANESN